MNDHTAQALDDGQPLVEFAALKPAEFSAMPELDAGVLRRASEWKYVPVRRFG